MVIAHNPHGYRVSNVLYPTIVCSPLIGDQRLTRMNKDCMNKLYTAEEILFCAMRY